MPVYHKLVRDLIPEIIEKSGKVCISHTLDHDEYVTALSSKLDEELAEYHAADSSHALEHDDGQRQVRQRKAVQYGEERRKRIKNKYRNKQYEVTVIEATQKSGCRLGADDLRPLHRGFVLSRHLRDAEPVEVLARKP